MRRLFPSPADDVDPAVAYADLPVVTGRPSVRLNMVASVDGAATVAGRSGGLGGPPDRRLFLALRSLADGILVAAGTVRSERYGAVVLAGEVSEARGGRGQAPVPSIAVVSRQCRFDWDSPFFAAATTRPIVVTVAAAPAENLARTEDVADVVIAGDTDVDLALALDALAARGVRSVLAEGGPTLNAQLAGAGLLDELCITRSPLLVGGEARHILSGPALDPPRRLTLHAAYDEDDFLFLRYRPAPR